MTSGNRVFSFVMLSLSKHALVLVVLLLPLQAHAQALHVPAASPSVATLDADSRAEGNEKALAIAIGKTIFASEWPAQVLKVHADGIDSHRVAGLVLSGVKFHQRLSARQFFDEVEALVGQTFRTAPVEEVDLWTTVPLSVGKGIVVSGDLAKPSSRTVFTLSVRRGETPAALARRLHAHQGIFLDEDWARTAFKGH
jgi:hypothetical protein